ncbi:MAG: alpha/beta hydrolase [Acidimicrobiaceae bacterium]|nr:alpha/beta hydrolase [Acidimicrobiaceae bacterium]
MATMTVHHGDVEIVYETIGSPDGEPLLLIMGGALSMLSWPAGFLDELLSRGFRVTRFDNRDAGRSTHFGHIRPPGAISVLLGFLGVPLAGRRVPYRLEDMADDTVAVLDAAGSESAHVVGISLGGAIAQSVAIRHPSRVRTLTMMSSSPGFGAAPMVRGVLTLARDSLAELAFRRSGQQVTPELIEDAAVRMHTTGPMRSVAYPPDETSLRQVARAEYEYSERDPGGPLRQAAAQVASRSRLAGLRRLRVPSLVIHGGADILAPLKGSQLIAKAIPRAKLVTFSGMGHDLPCQLWPDIAEAIADLAFGSDRSRAMTAPG